MAIDVIEFRAKIASGRQVFIPSRLTGFEPGDEVIVRVELKKKAKR